MIEDDGAEKEKTVLDNSAKKLMTGDNEIGLSTVNKVESLAEILGKIPPNWEMAENHGRANLVFDRDDIELDLNNESSYCKCCQQPLPEEEDWFPLCS